MQEDQSVIKIFKLISFLPVVPFLIQFPIYLEQRGAIAHGVLDLFQNGGRQIGMPMDPNDKSVDLIRVPRNERSE